MRNVAYVLTPDIAGSFVKKTAPLDQFARELRWVFLYKHIPPLNILNEALAEGSSPREAEWEPFAITASEHAALVEALCRNELERYRSVEPPPHVRTFAEWCTWVQSQS
jgi:hypothetical protein